MSSTSTAYYLGKAAAKVPFTGWIAAAGVASFVGYQWATLPQEPEPVRYASPATHAVDPHAEKIAAAAQQARIDRGPSIGMSAADVLKTKWGKPERVNRTESASGVREQWAYPGGNYIYFKNGKLESVSTRR